MDNRNLFLVVLDTGKSKIKVVADLVSGKDLCLFHRWHLLAVSLHGGRAWKLLRDFIIRSLIPFMSALSS